MKTSITRIICLFALLFILCANLSAQKYNKIADTPEICQCLKIVNDYLLESIDLEIYEKTGISANAIYNNLVIVANPKKHVIDLNELYQGIYEHLKHQEVDYSKIRYIMLQNSEYGSGLDATVILVSGEDFYSNINDFEAIKNASIYLEGTFESDKDPDIEKILSSGFLNLQYDSSWGASDREKAYNNKFEGCKKRVEKALKKAQK